MPNRKCVRVCETYTRCICGLRMMIIIIILSYYVRIQTRPSIAARLLDCQDIMIACVIVQLNNTGNSTIETIEAQLHF